MWHRNEHSTNMITSTAKQKRDIKWRGTKILFNRKRLRLFKFYNGTWAICLILSTWLIYAMKFNLWIPPARRRWNGISYSFIPNKMFLDGSTINPWCVGSYHTDLETFFNLEETFHQLWKRQIVQWFIGPTIMILHFLSLIINDFLCEVFYWLINYFCLFDDW